MLAEKIQNPTRILARIIRDVQKTERFDSLADLTEALKCRCAHLRIRWTPDDLTNAFRLIDSNAPLIPDRQPRRTNPTHLEHFDIDQAPIRRDEAAQLLQRLGVRLP